eukprot:4915533-Amphidinium_carterae.1
MEGPQEGYFTKLGMIHVGIHLFESFEGQRDKATARKDVDIIHDVLQAYTPCWVRAPRSSSRGTKDHLPCRGFARQVRALSKCRGG